MDHITESTAVLTPVRFSGFWVRFAAHIIDGLAISAVSMIVILPLSVVLGIFTAADKTRILEFFVQIAITLISMLLTWGYYIFMTYKYQATLGKMAVGARVVSESGEKLALGHVILRETVGKLISGIILCIGYFMIGFTKKKQGLHDLISSSVVEYTPEGPRKVVVGAVYGFYALILIVVFSIIALVIAAAIFFSSGNGDKNGSGDFEKEFEQLWENDESATGDMVRHDDGTGQQFTL